MIGAGARMLARFVMPRWGWALAAVAVVLLALWGFGELRWQQGYSSRDVEVQGLKDTIKAARDAQATADKAALANRTVKAGLHAGNAKGVSDANDQAHDDDRGVADALRLRIADLERAARSRAVPGAGSAAGAPHEEVEHRLSLADELALRESCQALMRDHDSLIDWENERLMIELKPPP